MNDQEFTFQIRRALDDSASALPYRVTLRLSAARRAALGRMPVARAQALSRARFSFAPAVAGMPAGFGGHEETVPLWMRVTMSILPLIIVVVGLAAISVWNDTANADETVDIDAAMLTDDVPIAAYADRGFGVFLKNARQ